MKQKYLFFIKRFFYYFYGEKFFKRLNYDWSKYPSRTEIIQSIIDEKKFNDYLEIGCDKDENFSKIKIPNKTGVDPLRGGTVRMTSDNYFSNNKNNLFDLIFLDGLHTYEQTIKDIFNSLKTLKKNGVIIVHDCLPKKIWNQIVPRMYGHWNGDVWKAIVQARTWEHVNTYTVLADQGLGVIKQEQNTEKLDLKNISFKNLKFKFFYENYNKIMRTISYEDFLKII